MFRIKMFKKCSLKPVPNKNVKHEYTCFYEDHSMWPRLAPFVNFVHAPAPVNNGTYRNPKLIVPRADLHRTVDHVFLENNFMLKEVVAIIVRTCGFFLEKKIEEIKLWLNSCCNTP